MNRRPAGNMEVSWFPAHAWGNITFCSAFQLHGAQTHNLKEQVMIFQSDLPKRSHKKPWAADTDWGSFTAVLWQRRCVQLIAHKSKRTNVSLLKMLPSMNFFLQFTVCWSSSAPGLWSLLLDLWPSQRYFGKTENALKGSGDACVPCVRWYWSVLCCQPEVPA